MCNDIIHAVALVVSSRTPLYASSLLSASTLPVFVNLQSHIALFKYLKQETIALPS